MPILIYNIQNDFVPLLYQWRHATENEPLSFRPIGEFLGIQLLAADLLGLAATAWDRGAAYQDYIPLEVRGMLRSRANTIEAGTSEVLRNILAERVLGLPRSR